jgi:hypothetical protein
MDDFSGARPSRRRAQTPTTVDGEAVQPPATAGRIVITSPSETRVSR